MSVFLMGPTFLAVSKPGFPLGEGAGVCHIPPLAYTARLISPCSARESPTRNITTFPVHLGSRVRYVEACTAATWGLHLQSPDLSRASLPCKPSLMLQPLSSCNPSPSITVRHVDTYSRASLLCKPSLSRDSGRKSPPRQRPPDLALKF